MPTHWLCLTKKCSVTTPLAAHKLAYYIHVFGQIYTPIKYPHTDNCTHYLFQVT